jgi:hypothetical protein
MYTLAALQYAVSLLNSKKHSSMLFPKKKARRFSDKFPEKSALSDKFALALISVSNESLLACSVAYDAQYMNTAPSLHFCGP